MMGNFIELQKACDISAGLVPKRKEARSDDKVAKIYKLITLKSFDVDGWIDLKYLDNFKSIEILDERYLTKENDILIRLSNPYTAIKITDEYIGFVIPSLFAVIRIKKDIIDPDYLTFMLNKESIKRSYFKNSMGLTIPMIRMQTIRETKIPLILSNKQLIVSKIYNLMIKEKMLYQQLHLEKEKYNKEITKRIVIGGNKNAK
ncbi:restriction endonuclease subunit S [Mycoplasmatota bacterium]|nr:restriction endonuclease subunit S [Mycoplasmatota bacterium]